jgi:hypothetical protein
MDHLPLTATAMGFDTHHGKPTQQSLSPKELRSWPRSKEMMLER